MIKNSGYFKQNILKTSNEHKILSGCALCTEISFFTNSVF